MSLPAPQFAATGGPSRHNQATPHEGAREM